jgi:hypothetical protein
LTEPAHIDPARLAALLDGRLSDADAAAVRAQLAAADDDTLAAYADAIAVSDELGEPGAVAPGVGTPVVPIRSARRRRRWMTPTIAVAASVAAIIVLTVRSSQRGTGIYEPFALVAALPATVALPTSHPWSVTRGSVMNISDRARAARVGVLLTDLELGAVRRDSARPEAMELATLVRNAPGSAPLVAALREYAAPRSSSLSARDRRALEAQAIRLVNVPFASAGAYLEAARLATAAGDRTFIERFPLASLSSLDSTQLDPAALAALRAAVAATHPPAPDLRTVHAAIENLLRLLAR